MKPFLIESAGESSRYRFHLLEKNFTVKVIQDPFDGIQIQEIKQEWGGGKNMPKVLSTGVEYDRVAAQFLAALATD